MPRRILFLLCCLFIGLALRGTALAQPLKLAVVTKPGASQNVLAEKFAELLAKESQGRFQVEILHSGMAGNETQIAEKTRLGQLQLCVVNGGVLDDVVPEVRVIEYPFLLADYAQVDKALVRGPGRRVLAAMGKAGLAGLAFGENGFRHLTNNVRPISNVEQVRGLRIRVMESEMSKALWTTLGALAVPHPWPINNLLASGQVEAQENPLWVVLGYELHKLQRYLTLTAHVYSAHVCAANLSWFRGLTQADQDLIRRAMEEAANHQRLYNRDLEAQVLAKLKSLGMRVEEHPDRESFKARAAALARSPLMGPPEVQATLENFLRVLD